MTLMCSELVVISFQLCPDPSASAAEHAVKPTRTSRKSRASRSTRRRGINRVRRLREKIGALPSPLAPIPPRPPGWRKDYWSRIIAELAAAEAVVAAELHAMIPRVRRRLKRDRPSDPRA